MPRIKFITAKELTVDSIADFYQNPPEEDVCVVEIDGKKADKVCESCYKAITKGDQCYKWNESVFTCMECGGADNADHQPITLEDSDL